MTWKHVPHPASCVPQCRRQLRAAALLGPELDLPAAAAGLAGLQEALTLHLHSASAGGAIVPAAAQVHPPLADEHLAQLLALADAAAQRFADVADAAAAAAADGVAAAGDAAAKKDNGWLQPLVTALETVLTFIEVGAALLAEVDAVWLEHGLLAVALAAFSPLSACSGAVPAALSRDAACSMWRDSSMHRPRHTLFRRVPTGPCPHLPYSLQDGLKKLNVPYSYGWSIVALTALIKVVTFPLTKKQARRHGGLARACACSPTGGVPVTIRTRAGCCSGCPCLRWTVRLPGWQPDRPGV